MTGRRQFQFKFVPLALLLAAAGLIVLLFLVLSSKKMFPTLTPGAYSGRISGITDQKTAFATLFVERMRSANAMLFVVLSEGWKPQVIPIQYYSNKKQTQAVTLNRGPIMPVSIQSGGRSFSLHGTVSGGEFSGEVLEDGKRCGVWSLQPVSVENLRQKGATLDPDFSLSEWLHLKGKYRHFLKEYQRAEAEVTKKQEQLDRLTILLDDDETLRLRAQVRRKELEIELKQFRIAHKEKQKDVEKLVRELQQLVRITRRGRAIELARRVAKRENKWYFVNWMKGADLSALEESLADRMDVDLIKLRAKVKRATEIQALKNTVAKERKRIHELQKAYQERIEGGPKRRDQKQRKRHERPWWKRWDTVFGLIIYD